MKGAKAGFEYALAFLPSECFPVLKFETFRNDVSRGKTGARTQAGLERIRADRRTIYCAQCKKHHDIVTPLSIEYEGSVTRFKEDKFIPKSQRRSKW